jgi:hypothetical protein
MEIILQLLISSHPAIRYKTRVHVLGKDPASPELLALQREIAASELVKTLLSERDSTGCISYHHPYTKWVGAHWVLAGLADLGYPPGDRSLLPLFDQVYGWLLSDWHLRSIKTIEGRVRRCASQEGNALYAALALGLDDERADELARRLVRWQWPDGGWNCDKNPSADSSSFMETLIPLRALILYARQRGDAAARQAAERAAQVFLKRELFKRQRDGTVISEHFLLLHYPCYWHYDILFGLKVMAEGGWIDDPRCQAALDVLEARRLPDGGFPAQERYYRLTDRPISGRSRVDWGGTSLTRSNEFVSVEALAVLRRAGRLELL